MNLRSRGGFDGVITSGARLSGERRGRRNNLDKLHIRLLHSRRRNSVTLVTRMDRNGPTVHSGVKYFTSLRKIFQVILFAERCCNNSIRRDDDRGIISNLTGYYAEVSRICGRERNGIRI